MGPCEAFTCSRQAEAKQEDRKVLSLSKPGITNTSRNSVMYKRHLLCVYQQQQSSTVTCKNLEYVKWCCLWYQYIVSNSRYSNSAQELILIVASLAKRKRQWRYFLDESKTALYRYIMKVYQYLFLFHSVVCSKVHET